MELWLIVTEAFGVTYICRVAHRDRLRKVLWGCYGAGNAWATRFRLSSFTDPISVLSYYNTLAIQRHCEKCPIAPMNTCRKGKDDTIWQVALTMPLRRAKWTHKFIRKMSLRKAFWQLFDMPKILPILTKFLRSLRKSTGGHTKA